ncbi:MAG: hypothetical protein ACRC0V_09945 [Fusobacteriaceae bacterium]
MIGFLLIVIIFLINPIVGIIIAVAAIILKVLGFAGGILEFSLTKIIKEIKDWFNKPKGDMLK